METLSTLRKRHPTFFYKNYSYKFIKRDLHISFDFLLSPNIHFNPKVVLKNIPLYHGVTALQGRASLAPLGRGEDVIKNFVFHIGLIEIPSYWKAACSPQIIIEAGALNAEQLRWWKDLYIQGLGEFFFRNKIDFTTKGFLSIKSTASPRLSLGSPRLSLGTTKILVPVGGGKDAIVTLETLKQSKKEILPFVLNPSSLHKRVLFLAGYRIFISVKRTIDQKLLDLNRKGYLNGHTPFSAYLAFLSAFIAVLFDTKYIAVSHERSSNEGNVNYKNKAINHQYSKTYEFEAKFRSYSKKYLASSLDYFSLMRPLYELQIAKIFSKYPAYFKAFLSCNEAQKTHSQKPSLQWCGKCPKCLFVFIILYPFVKEKTLVSIFKKNLFQDAMLVSLLEELVGKREIKPFDCVGTKKETLVSLFLALEKQHKELPILLKYFKNTILPEYPKLQQESMHILKTWNNANFLPKALMRCLNSEFKHQ